mmetsp:Transcript_19871/g.33436  ORF Transcript_19871/g.33436 Transcript_19871/m.33436 type:complete len:799 (-) Transcript_19871:205-2601(-)
MSRSFSIFDKPPSKKRKAAEEKQCTSTQYECPMCQRVFQDSSFLHMHVSTHFAHEIKSPTVSQTPTSDRNDDVLPTCTSENSGVQSAEKPIPKKESISLNSTSSTPSNVFSVLMSAKQSVQTNKIHFSLDLVDGKLLPHFDFNSRTSRPATEPSPAIWSVEDIKLRKISSSYTRSKGDNETRKSTGDNNGVTDFTDILDGNNFLTISTNIPSSQLPSDHTKKRYMHNSSTVGIFKSMIQKGFRRGNVSECTALCTQLLFEHPDECLRRLPIILIEDGTLHAGLPVLVWLMIAVTKGYHPPEFLLAICVQIFTEGASCAVRDHAYGDTTNQEYEEDSGVNDDGETDNVGCHSSAKDIANKHDNVGYTFEALKHLPACGTLIGSLFLRMMYGGMTGDMQMIFSHILAWTRRFTATGAVEDSILNKLVKREKEQEQEQERNVTYTKKARFVWFIMGSKPTSGISINNLPVFRRPEKGNYFDVFFNYFLKDCDIDALNIKDFQIAANKNKSEVVMHYLAPGTTFLIPVSDKDPVTSWASILLDIFDKYNVSTRDYIFIHTADESLYYQNPELIEFYLRWKKVYRHNWWNIPAFQKLHSENRLDWYPLHHLKMTNMSLSDMVPASLRTINITFRGNTATNRRRLPEVMELEKVLNTKIRGKLFKSASFSADSSQSAYETEMLNSRFCLNIRGRTPECHRFYETLEYGCIPVFVDAYQDFDYSYQFQSWKSKIKEVEWRKGHELPFVWVKNPTELKTLFDRLLDGGEEGLRELDVMQSESAEWWVAAKEFMKTRYEEAVCTFPQ